MADPTPLPTEDVKYPTWEPEVRAVMLEIDAVKVKEKVAAAELAMTKRTQQLKSPDDDVELHAIKNETLKLKTVLAELAQHPELKK